jgi:intein/homing endonuclease
LIELRKKYEEELEEEWIEMLKEEWVFLLGKSETWVISNCINFSFIRCGVVRSLMLG